ncbi:MAG TPA: aminotransferase class III-fold pyridoxal phosphate-dependent enzyme, partial [Bryobacteraceae bacterium]|nr:aminotransferase class III-fold pyridoxal phosphate-dependent enzyme [Bryobacteraceae bacterium]
SAKGMANGYSMAMTVTRPDLAAKWKGATISTFGGNPISSAASLATIEAIVDEGLPHNAAVTGARLRERLLGMQEKYAVIGDVRGMGLMQAIELVEDRETKAPATAATAALMEAARENRLLIGRGGIDGNVIRVTPPLNISKSDVDDFAERLSASFGYIERSDHGRKSVLSRIENH